MTDRKTEKTVIGTRNFGHREGRSMRTVTTTDEGNRTADGWNPWSAVRHSRNTTERAGQEHKRGKVRATKRERDRDSQSNNKGDDE